MPIGFEDLLQTTAQFASGLNKGVVSTDHTFGGVRSKIDDWTDLHLLQETSNGITRRTFQDDGTAAAPGNFKPYSTLFYVADGRALIETNSGTGAIRLNSSGEFVSGGGQLYTHDPSGSASPGYYVYIDATATGGSGAGTDKLPKFTVTGTPGSGSTVLPAGYQSFSSANNSSSAIAVTENNSGGTFNLVFATAGNDQQLFVDTTTTPMSYVPNTGFLTLSATVNSTSLSTGTLGVTGDIVTDLVPGNGTGVYADKNLGSLSHPWHEIYVKDGLFFEGATADDSETKIVATDPTQDNTITLPDATGNVVLTGGVSGDIAIAADYQVTIADEAVSLAKMAHIATDSFLGRTTGSTGDVEVLNATQAVAILGLTNAALTTNNLSVFATTTSAQLAGLISDETGTGALVFAGSPTLTGTISAAAANFSGAVSISGNLTVAGTVSQTNSQEVNFNDTRLRLNVPTDLLDGSIDDTAAPAGDVNVGLEVFNGAASSALSNGPLWVYNYSTDHWGASIQGSETTLDNVKAFKFDVTTSGLGAEANATNDVADLYGTAPAARSNATNVRSVGAVSKCTIDITTDANNNGSNFAPVAAAANGYPIQHDLDTSSIFVFALKTHQAGGSGTGGAATAIGEPQPIFCKFKVLTANIVEVSVGITIENEKYDIIVIG